MDSHLNRPFKMIVFDWDGTAVANRREDATRVRLRIERLLKLGVLIVVITGTNFGNVDKQLSAAIRGSHKRRLYICTNRGSEVFGFDDQAKPVLLHRRVATREEKQRLTEVADRVRQTLESRTGLPIRIVYNRLNRRKIDLIPLPEWSDPPKSVIDALLEAVQQRLRGAGLSGGLQEAIEITKNISDEAGLKDSRLTTDVKHIEVGLTDKGDSVVWAMRELAAANGIAGRDVLIAGDEFGPIAGFPGSDYFMAVDAARGATFVSVGIEPNGVPPEVINLGGGPDRFRELLDQQISLHRSSETMGSPRSSQTGRPSLEGAKGEGTGQNDLMEAAVFNPTPDPLWVLVEEGFNPAREHEIESLFTVANGYSGTRGAVAEANPVSRPATFIAGVFDAGEDSFRLPELVVAPNWAKLAFTAGDEEIRLEPGRMSAHRRILDMRRGVMLREWRHRDDVGRITELSFLRFTSLADRKLLAQLVAIIPLNYTERVSIEYALDSRVANGNGAVHLQPEISDKGMLVVKTLSSGVTLAMATSTKLHAAYSLEAGHSFITDAQWTGESWDFEADIGDRYVLSRLVAVSTSRDAENPAGTASSHVELCSRQNFVDLLSDHEKAWAERWRTADIEIAGDAEAQRALRFALYHLIGAANPEDDRVSVGARDLSGEAYKGHVFWDTEIYMLPFYTFTHPPSARALLMYRYHTLPAARARATELGFRGALYPWESAATGEDVTPPFVLTPEGEIIPILSRVQEHHISADIPYSVWQYWKASGDDTFFVEAGAEIVLETARFWASRVSPGDDGLYHINHIIGPDEYHEDVDDNAYTNVMAQWVLERGVETAKILEQRWPDRWQSLTGKLQLTAGEVAEWSTVATRMFRGYMPDTSLFEQFAGYFELEYVDLDDYEPRTAPMDIILGHERTKETQVIKQADVVLLTNLLWDSLPPAAREANFRYYEPRTGHGSSLSPSVYALVAARLGDLDTAQKYFKQTAEIDLANNMGNAAEGVHMGALGGLWQAVVLGFAGMSLREDGISFDPHMPAEWSTIRFPVQWHGRLLRVALSATPPAIEAVMEGDAPMVIGVTGGPSRTIEAGKRFRTHLEEGVWTSWEEDPT